MGRRRDDRLLTALLAEEKRAAQKAAGQTTRQIELGRATTFRRHGRRKNTARVRS